MRKTVGYQECLLMVILSASVVLAVACGVPSASGIPGDSIPGEVPSASPKPTEELNPGGSPAEPLQPATAGQPEATPAPTADNRPKAAPTATVVPLPKGSRPAPTSAVAPPPSSPCLDDAGTPVGSRILKRWELAEDATPLHRAALEGACAEVETLLDQGANINAVTRLQRIGADLTQKSTTTTVSQEGGAPASLVVEVRPNFIRSVTPLKLAAINNTPAVVELLLLRGAESEHLKRASYEGEERTALHFAARSNTPEVMEVFLDLGANVNIQNSDGLTPLHSAAFRGRDMVSLLLDRGADIHASGESVATPFHWASGHNSAEVVALLLDHGADINGQGGPAKETPLHFAAENNEAAVVELLLDRGADPTLEEIWHRTPCDFARGNMKLKGTSVLDQLCTP